MNWVQINIQVNEDFRYMKIHIFLIFFFYGPEIFSGPIYNYSFQ